MANMAAAPAPCTVRAAIRKAAVGASAQASEDSANRVRPSWNSRRRPNRSASEPHTSSSAASESA